jgi:hypothetical protein
MANVRRLGFLPTRQSGGATVTLRKARVLTNNTLAINFGDGVKFAGTGDVVACAAGTDEAILLSSVAQGAVYTPAVGPRVEARYLPPATTYTSSVAWPENGSYVYIVDNAVMVEFEANVTTAAVALTGLNLNYAMVLTTSTTGFSNHELTTTGAAITATIPWRVREYVQRADNDITLVDCKVLAMINAGQTEPAVSAQLGT